MRFKLASACPVDDALNVQNTSLRQIIMTNDL